MISLYDNIISFWKNVSIKNKKYTLQIFANAIRDTFIQDDIFEKHIFAFCVQHIIKTKKSVYWLFWNARLRISMPCVAVSFFFLLKSKRSRYVVEQWKFLFTLLPFFWTMSILSQVVIDDFLKFFTHEQKFIWYIKRSI